MNDRKNEKINGIKGILGYKNPSFRRGGVRTFLTLKEYYKANVSCIPLTMLSILLIDIV